MPNKRFTYGITFPLGPFGVSLCIKRSAVGCAIGVRKQLGRSKP